MVNPNSGVDPLEQWLEHQLSSRLEADIEFPTNDLREAYIATIGHRKEQDVFRLLRRFLLPSGMLIADQFTLLSLVASRDSAPELFRAILNREQTRRLLIYTKDQSQPPPWEGITWVMDLLPHFPKEAIAALDAYILAHAQQLPDARYRGLLDAVIVI